MPSDTAELRAPPAPASHVSLRGARSTIAARPALSALLLVTLVLAALTALMYGPPVVHDGFYYDDWAFLAALNDQHSHTWLSLFQGCTGYDNGNRPGACAYHTTMHWLLGSHASLYHVAAALTLFLTAVLLFVLLRRCRFPAWAAGATAALFVVFPGSDATRLWPTANNLAWALLLYLAAVLVGLAALRRRGWRAGVLHGLAIVMLLGVALTYDGMIPVVALSGIFYYLARRDRVALRLAGVNLLLAAAYGVWRLKFGGIQKSAELTVGRSPSQLASREAHLLRGGWSTVETLLLPGGSVGIVVAAAAVLTIAAAALLRPSARRAIGLWIAVAAGSAVYAAITLTAYITANTLYEPAPYSLFNRLNIAAAPAYCLGFVALLAALVVALKALARARDGWRASALAPIGVVAVLAALVVASDYGYSRATQRSYGLSWKAQDVAMRGIRRAVANLPDRSADIVSFGHPVLEQRFIPVFAASWDLRGAIDAETRDNPPVASPFLPGWGCSPTGVSNGVTTWASYTGTPIWFVDAKTGAALRVMSQVGCQRALKHMTPLPAFDPAGL